MTETASLHALLDHPDTLRVRKRPVPVQVTFAAADGTCETLEGAVRYRAGDALLTGDGGERWPVRRPDFRAAYRPLTGTPPMSGGTYVKQIASAVARRLANALDVPVGWASDPLRGQPGNWLLAYADGTFGILRDDIFREAYEADAGETRWPPPASDTLT